MKTIENSTKQSEVKTVNNNKKSLNDLNAFLQSKKVSSGRKTQFWIIPDNLKEKKDKSRFRSKKRSELKILLENVKEQDANFESVELLKLFLKNFTNSDFETRLKIKNITDSCFGNTNENREQIFSKVIKLLKK